MRFREAAALPIRPPLELGRLAQIEAVQERPPIQPDRLGRRATTDRLPELGHIGSDDLRV